LKQVDTDKVSYLVKNKRIDSKGGLINPPFFVPINRE
jgi:hypothetical protein